MKTLSALVAVWVMALAAVPSWADDSTAALGIGGIVLTKGTPVRMKTEDLYVSPLLVRVRFEFLNETGKDIDTLVAFPLPDLSPDCATTFAYGAMEKDPANFVGFKVFVDGKPILFKTEQRATVKGRDVTALLKSTGAPINTFIGDGCNKLAALDGPRRKRLITAGVAEAHGSSRGDLQPLWGVRTRFYWPQRFPAHKTVVIEHSYKPVTGTSYDRIETKEFCIDASSRRQLRKIENENAKVPELPAYIEAYTTDYVLATARNWNGHIGTFRMTLDKLDRKNVLSLCWGGKLVKAGPSTITFSAANFVPNRDIHMAVYSSTRSERPFGRLP